MGLNFDPLSARFASARRVIYGRRGMVCASQPLAAQAGLDILRRGGNAIDAAIAAAACLAVLEPTSNGLGGESYARDRAEYLEFAAAVQQILEAKRNDKG